MAKKLTLDDLAQMVKRGFDAMDARFDQTAKKEDLKQVEQRLEKKMDDGFFAVNRRIDLLHEDISDLPDVREEVKDLDKRVDRVERKVGLAR